MNRVIQNFMLVAGATAFLSVQAAHAAPSVRQAPAVDPLVSISMLGTPQSRAAVCAAGASAAAAGAAAAAAAQVLPSGSNCLFPVTDAAPPPPAPVSPGIAPAPPPPGKSIGWLPLAIGALLIAALAVLLLWDGDDDGPPISP